MIRRSPVRTLFSALALLSALAYACSSDSPTEPDQPAPPPPNVTGEFAISISASPSQLQVGQERASDIVVRVVRADTGQPPADGTAVVISTTLGSFAAPDSGVQTVTVGLVGGVARASLFPSDNEGTAVVSAQLQSVLNAATASTTVRFLPVDTFFLSFVEPRTGQGGDVVAIRGGGFEAPVRVLFGGAAARVLGVSPNRIRVEVPPAGAIEDPTTVTVQVTIRFNETDSQTDALPDGFTYLPGGTSDPGPVIFSIDPTSGPDAGGTRVTIRGDNFESPLSVTFGGIEATVESVSDGTLVVRTPPAFGLGRDNRGETVDVVVTDLDTGLSDTETDAFTYISEAPPEFRIDSIDPNEGPAVGGTEVTIFGEGFRDPARVEIAGVDQEILSVSPDRIVFRTVGVEIPDCRPLSAAVVVTDILTGAQASGPEFTFRPSDPVILSIDPTDGDEDGGTLVTIGGSGFTETMRVFFGDSAGTSTTIAADGTTITVRTPAFAGAFDETSCDDDGDGTVGTRFVPTAVDVEVTDPLTSCDDVVDGGFTYEPDDESCRGDTGPPPPPPPPADPECSDGIDNDGDGLSDHASVNPINPDPECTGPNDDDEAVL